MLAIHSSSGTGSIEGRVYTWKSPRTGQVLKFRAVTGRIRLYNEKNTHRGKVQVERDEEGNCESISPEDWHTRALTLARVCTNKLVLDTHELMAYRHLASLMADALDDAKRQGTIQARAKHLQQTRINRMPTGKTAVSFSGGRNFEINKPGPIPQALPGAPVYDLRKFFG